MARNIGRGAGAIALNMAERRALQRSGGTIWRGFKLLCSLILFLFLMHIIIGQ